VCCKAWAPYFFFFFFCLSVLSGHLAAASRPIVCASYTGIECSCNWARPGEDLRTWPGEDLECMIWPGSGLARIWRAWPSEDLEGMDLEGMDLEAW
jgi:hypothetical protein